MSIEDVRDGSELNNDEYADFRKHTKWATVGLSVCGCSRIWPVIFHEWFEPGSSDELGWRDDHDNWTVYECASCGATSTDWEFVAGHARSTIWCDKDVCSHE